MVAIAKRPRATTAKGIDRMAKSALELEIQGDVKKETKKLADTFLNTLGWKGIRKLERFATLNGARAIEPDVRKAAPRKSGKLAKYVKARRSRYTPGGAMVGPQQGKGKAWYAKFVVYGTKAHIQSPRDQGPGWLVFDQQVVSRVDHPGAKGDNFVAETAERNVGKVRNAFEATIGKLLEDEAFRNKVLGFHAEYVRAYNIRTGRSAD
jgi:HK97 gp10 family phage protein